MGVWVREDVRAAFRELISARGDDAIGWKIGVASVAAMANAGIEAPLVGCLLASGRIASGAAIDVSGWVAPFLEPEIAVWLGADVPAGATRAQASAAIASISLAFELVDIDGPLTDAPAALRGNVFQRGYIFGERVPAVRPPAVTVLVDDVAHAEVGDPVAVVGDFGELVQHVADVLGDAGRTLRAGEVVIAGTLAPPLPLAAGAYALRAPGLGEISLAVAG